MSEREYLVKSVNELAEHCNDLGLLYLVRALLASEEG